MPHVHSAEARARRLDRARLLGFLQPLPQGMEHVRVPSGFGTRIRLMVDSLVIHKQHVSQIGMPRHFARSAALAARSADYITEEELTCALQKHRIANKAKHDWRSSPSSSSAVPIVAAVEVIVAVAAVVPAQVIELPVPARVDIATDGGLMCSTVPILHSDFAAAGALLDPEALLQIRGLLRDESDLIREGARRDLIDFKASFLLEMEAEISKRFHSAVSGRSFGSPG